MSAWRGRTEGGRRRGQAGAALVELALVLPFLTLIVFGTIDLGRVFRLTARLEGAAREGSALAQFAPFRVDAGCRGTANVVDRITAEDPDLSTAPGFAVRVYKRDAASGALVPPGGIGGCDAASPGVTVVPGDRVIVQVEVFYEPLTPVVSQITGQRVTLRAAHEVVVQG